MSATPEVSQPVPGSPVFVSFAASFDGTSTTDFLSNATSPDGSPLAYVWTLQNLSCGSLVQPQQRTNMNGYFHGATAQFPQGCPFAVETQTRVTVLVARAADLDASGTPKDGAPYFTYSQVARAHDASTTASIDAAPALHYFGVASAAASPSSSSVAPPASAVTPSIAATGSGFPLVGLIIGVVVVGAAGTLAWYVVRRRDDGQVDLVHPFVEVDLVHPFVDIPPLEIPPSIEPPPLPPAETFTPPAMQQPDPHADDTGTEQDDRSGTGPDDEGDGGGEVPPPPLIFGPRLIDLPLGEPPQAPSTTQVEQPTLPPTESFPPPTPPTSTPPPVSTTPTGSPPVTPPVTPPVVPPVTPPPQQTAHHRLPRHCAPQVDDIFIDAMNRVLSRLRTLFGTEPSSLTGMAFLAMNGGELDFWVLNPQTTCPGPHCPATMTLCGRCYPPHLLSDIMYGFVGGYFDLENAIAIGGIAYQLEKWAAGGSKQVVSPQHVTEAQPAYQVGVRLGRACRDPQHAGKWRLSKDDVCAELTAMNVQTALLKMLLEQPLKDDCPPATCVNTAADTDWSRKPWSWETPLDETQRWAVTGKF